MPKLVRQTVPGIIGGFLILLVATCGALAIGMGSDEPVQPARAESRGASPLAASDGWRNAALLARERAGEAYVALDRRLATCPSGRETFWRCAGVPVQQQVMRGRTEWHLLMPVLRGLEPGPCREITSGLAAVGGSVGKSASVVELAFRVGPVADAPTLPQAVRSLRRGIRVAQRIVASSRWQSCREHAVIEPGV